MAAALRKLHLSCWGLQRRVQDTSAASTDKLDGALNVVLSESEVNNLNLNYPAFHQGD